MTIAARHRQFLSLVVVLSLLEGARTVAAAPGAKADRAAARAMNELFSAARFDDAKTALETTISECSGCSKHTLAVLHLDLGIILVTGFENTAKGTAEMKTARTLDPALSVDPAFATNEVQAAFDAAKSGPPGPGEVKIVLEDDAEEDEKPAPKSHVAHAKTDATLEVECSAADDCQGNQECKAGVCVGRPPPPPSGPSVWLSLGLIQEVAFASGSEVCTEDSQVGSNDTCLRASGSQYHGTPLPGEGGKLSGASIATTRLTLASYFALADDVSFGFRVGYALAGRAPTPDGGRKFFPLHGEVQLSYWLSPDALSGKHVGTFLEASTGFAQMVGHGSVQVQENTAVPPPITQLDNPPTQKLDAYQTSGSAFVGAGLGLFVPFGPRTALIADLRFSLFFPTSGFAIGLGAGVAFGL